ncbi:hypothetical protein A2690_01990 [Candidatus Roizmanbacteria bacterium RIFCSPHIGHO2_01_FULL_39_12b]|uniref:Aminoglycoside phosphotransferase domain-containing protein n=1 Tax=Candidatus Roizmanbacteria bacterium RIFCSPHIGHO2_01_FULL_39_12b TaxID=1802030 RepID=A0A1F7G9N7_9BACT|nr:MAG: hypothetical protein A2690_01990 [Candidatus Roizmanbacteria bacterium RIFCSPHIGHO2_01_FULL_39_12b]
MGSKLHINYKRFDDNSNLLIKNCGEEIIQILRKIEITPDVDPIIFTELTQGNKHRYYSICKTKRGEKLFFHALIINTGSAREQMIREINFGKFILNNTQRISKDIFPEYVDFSSVNDRIMWILSKVLPYVSLEKAGEIEKCRDISKKTIISIVDGMNYINQQFNLDDIESLQLRKFTISQMRDQIEARIEKHLRLKIIDVELAQLVNDYCYSTIFNSLIPHNCFIHGDFHSGNILLSKDQKSQEYVKIIDWEDYQIGNVSYDIALLFIRLWREPKIRKEITAIFLNSIKADDMSSFHELFRFNIIYFAINQGLTTAFLELELTEIYKRKMWFRGLLKNALVSYESLMDYHKKN